MKFIPPYKVVPFLLFFFLIQQIAYAATTPYQDKATFVAATGASSATGPLPNLGLVATTPADPPTTVGALDFSVGPTGSALYIGGAGVAPGGDWYPPTATNEIAMNLESLEVETTGGGLIYSIGFDFIEPNATMPPWGGVPVESDYQIQLFNGAVLVGQVTFPGATIPNDIVTFLGVTSDIPFNRVVITDLTGNNDDEYWGEFFLSALAPVASYNTLGSFLLFPKFDIRLNTTTQLRIVNNGESNVNGHINFICPGVKNVNEFCAALDTTVTFTPHQTRVIDVTSLHPPCNQGYVVVYAYGAGGQFDVGGLAARNRPIAYNFLSGSYRIRSGLRQEIETPYSIQSPQPVGTILGTPRTLRFDGTDYFSIHTTQSIDFRADDPGEEDDPDVGSRLTLLTLDVLAGMQNPPAVGFIDFWNAAEVPFSTSIEFICWTDTALASIDSNFLFDNLGTTRGSMLITPFANCPLPGGCPPLTPYDPTLLGQLQEFGDGTTAARLLFHDTVPKGAEFQPR